MGEGEPLAGYNFKVAHVARAVEEIEQRFSLIGNSYPNHDDATNSAEYAADFWSTDKTVHDKVFPWLCDNAVRLGITYVISWCRIWSVARANEGVRRYRVCDQAGTSSSQRHTNHLHTSFSTIPPDAEPPEEEDDMPLSDEDVARIADATARRVLNIDGIIQNPYGDQATNTHIGLKTLARNVGRDLLSLHAKVDRLLNR